MKANRIRGLLPVVLAAAAFAGPGLLTGATPRTPAAQKPAALSTDGAIPGAPNLDRFDRRFLETVAGEEQTDTALAGLADDRSRSERVRDFARQLGLEHSQLGLQVTALARAKGIPLEADLVGDRVYRRLSDTAPAKFDAQFVRTMAERRRNDLQLYERAARDAQDPQVRAFARAHVAQLRRQLATAQQLQ